jgi:hypothetical protein
VLLAAFEESVEGEFECVIEHAWDEFAEEWAGAFDAGVFVDFDEPDFAFCVDDEIESEYFEAGS